MITIRIKRTRHDMAIVSKEAICDPALSLVATGLLAYLLVNEDEDLTLEDLLAAKPQDSHGTIIAALNELQEAGYLSEGEDNDDY